MHAVTRTRSTADWIAALESAAVPCGPINDIGQVFDDPQVQHRGMKIALPHRAAGEVPLVANPIQLSETPVAYHNAPPGLGADTRAVLAEMLGKQPAELDQLAAKGAI